MLTLVVNPIAGNGLAQRTHERVRALLESRGIEYRSFVTQAPGDAEALCRDFVREGAEAVAVLGGDGTLNEVVNGLALSDVTCLLVPCGTGNDFAKAMRLPKEPLGTGGAAQRGPGAH